MKNYGSSKLLTKKFSLSFSNWFCSPDLGMKKYEILNRASAFLVRSQDTNFKSKYHVLTSSHVVAPWKYTKYYPHEWLKYVNENHIFCSVELRHPDGTFITQHELHGNAYHHASRDVVAMHLDNEIEDMKQMDLFEYEVLDLADDDDLDKLGNELLFSGHNVLGKVTETEDLRLPIPFSTTGALFSRNTPQTFARTRSILGEGMCGGPVILEKSSSSSSSAGGSDSSDDNKASKMNSEPICLDTTRPGMRKVICGIVEGIVPMDYLDHNLRGLAGFIPANDISSFLRDVESGKILPTQGGKHAFEMFKGDDGNIDWNSIVNGRKGSAR